MKKTFRLPWPPSVNHYWVRTKFGQAIGKRGKAFREEVCTLVNTVKVLYKVERLQVSIEAFPPDNRKRDLDNIFKATLDALEHANVYTNDNQIDKIDITRREVIKPGYIIVRISEV